MWNQFSPFEIEYPEWEVGLQTSKLHCTHVLLYCLLQLLFVIKVEYSFERMYMSISWTHGVIAKVFVDYLFRHPIYITFTYTVNSMIYIFTLPPCANEPTEFDALKSNRK